MVDIVHFSLGVDELDEVLDDLHDIFAGQHLDIHRRRHAQLLVYAVAAYLAEVVALLAEEEVGYDFAGRRVIRWLGVAQLSVDILDSLLFGVRSIFLKSVEDNRIVDCVGALLVEKDCLDAALEDSRNIFFGDDGLTVDDNVVALDRHNLAGVFVGEVLDPRFQHTGGKLAPHCFLEVGGGHLDVFGQTEDLDDVLVALESDSAQKSGHGQLLLAVDVGIHHVVDVSGELDPAAAERDNTRTVELCSVGMSALSEEDARRTVELRDDDTLGSVDNKGSLLGHVGNLTEINILNNRGKVLVVRVGTIELKLCFEGHAVGQAMLKTLVDSVARRIDIIVEKFQHEIVARVGNGEVLGKYLIKPFVVALLGGSVELHEVLERL